MTFAEKLKTLRKQTGMSQEKLAEKLCVSRQAVTKWESGAGIPDIENAKGVAALFNVSLDELLSDEALSADRVSFLYESVTEYDIDSPKNYDMNYDVAKSVSITGTDGEKVRVRLASNEIESIQSDFKIKLDDSRDDIDIDISRKNGVSDSTAKESLHVFVTLPKKYIRGIELGASAESVSLSCLECEEIELDIKAGSLSLDGVKAKVETNCNIDMDIVCDTLDGSFALNQLSAVSKIHVPADAAFTAQAKGAGTKITYENGEDFSTPNAENKITLNGSKSELVICK